MSFTEFSDTSTGSGGNGGISLRGDAAALHVLAGPGDSATAAKRVYYELTGLCETVNQIFKFIGGLPLFVMLFVSAIWRCSSRTSSGIEQWRSGEAWVRRTWR